MAEKKIYQHHERTTEADLLADLQTRELGSESATNFLIFANNEGDPRYVMTMASKAMSESGGNVYIGSSVTPKGTLHVHTASAGGGGVSNLADELIVENSTNGGITLRVPDASYSTIYFASPTNSQASYIRWSYDAKNMLIGTSLVGSSLNLRSGNAINTVILGSDGVATFYSDIVIPNDVIMANGGQIGIVSEALTISFNSGSHIGMENTVYFTDETHIDDGLYHYIGGTFGTAYSSIGFSTGFNALWIYSGLDAADRDVIIGTNHNDSSIIISPSTQTVEFKRTETSTSVPFASTYLTGAPFVVASSTVVTNLNADLLDGNHSSAFATSAHLHDTQTLQCDGINSDGGAFSFSTTGDITFNQSIILADGKTIGQPAGPLLTFDDTNNFLEITGCNVGIGVSDPDTKLEILHAGNQLKLSYDGTDNCVFAVDTAGDLTITPSGTKVTIDDDLTITGSLTSTDTAFAIKASGNMELYPGGLGSPNVTIADTSVYMSVPLALTTIGYNVTGAISFDSNNNVLLKQNELILSNKYLYVGGSVASPLSSITYDDAGDSLVLNVTDTSANGSIVFNCSGHASQSIYGIIDSVQTFSSTKTQFNVQTAFGCLNETAAGEGFVDTTTATASPESTTGEFFLTLTPTSASTDYYYISDGYGGQMMFLANKGSVTATVYNVSDGVGNDYFELIAGGKLIIYWSDNYTYWEVFGSYNA